MRIATFLPHVGVYGGVRRYLELGNAWSTAGHAVTLYHPDGTPPRWLRYAGRVAPLELAKDETSDVALCSEPHTYAAFRAHGARRHVYYCVLEKDPGLALALRDRDLLLAANSTPLRRSLENRSRRPVLDGAGGINVEQFAPDPARRAATPLRVLLNGRRARPKKGTDLLLRALESLGGGVPVFEIVLVDSVAPGEPDPREGARLPRNARYVLDPRQDELAALYQSAHVFLAAERKAGWCNTAIEAMACGCAVGCTRSGTTDFARDGETALVIPFRHPWPAAAAARRLLRDAALRERLGAAGRTEASRWTWGSLARRLIDLVGAVRP